MHKARAAAKQAIAAQQIAAGIEAISDRLERIEAKLGITPDADAPAAKAAPAPAKPAAPAAAKPVPAKDAK